MCHEREPSASTQPHNCQELTQSHYIAMKENLNDFIFPFPFSEKPLKDDFALKKPQGSEDMPRFCKKNWGSK